MDATIFSFGLYAPGSQTIDVVWQVERGKELSGGSFPLGDGLTRHVVASREARLIANWALEAPLPRGSSGLRPNMPQSAIAVPLLLGDEVIGVMAVASYMCHAYTDEHLELLLKLAAEAATVVAGLHVSEKHGVQARRQVSEWDAILANIDNGLLTVDARGCPVRINRVARELLTRNEASIVLGEPLTGQSDAWPLSGRVVARALQSAIQDLISTHEPQEGEVALPGPVRRTLNFRVTPIHDVDNGFHGGVVVLSDVTGRREVERLKDDVFAVASHDLKTPATVIKIEAQTLQRNLRQGKHAALEESLAIITAQADRLSSLINNLMLDLSRIDSGRLDIVRAPTDLRDITVRMARALGATSRAHTIRVSAPHAVIGLWDATRLEQVVQNLLTNALKYSPNGGCIDVSVCDDGDQATLTVRDQGIGLAPDEAPRIFDRCFRSSQVADRFDGIGLGLYICRAIVNEHGGRIWAESAGPGRGTTLTVSLPLGLPSSAP